ncbi:MAG TPA: response regulator [Anseongella sp.]|nr:response regulator [Anseongella sp.]
MISAILIDDEPLSREIIKEYLSSYKEIQIVEECNDGFQGMKAISQWDPDLVFLDIQMPKISGLELLELLEQPPAVIFTTAFDEYAIQAFEANAVDYLLKPFSRARFDKAMQKWMLRQSSGVPAGKLPESIFTPAARQNRVVVKYEGKIKIIPVQEIHYLEASGDYVKIRSDEGSFMKNRTMQFFEGLLDSQQFIRIHRSYIVNLNQITRIDPYEKDAHLAVLTSGIQLPVSKSGYIKLKDVLGL